ncbi:maleylpyruvate isomerase N-terminal domain-containing protein [Microbacterium sp. CCNWLW134]|uniref:maleylpyruvate isomerase N-terminal domain-containing protein n=1 Tax=Microbacterium sp. CCNWLW134 TaxID=3122064 RepID=UPI0030103B7C
MLDANVHLGAFERASAAFAAEIDEHDANAAIGWSRWPTVSSLVTHLGGIHRWAAEIVRTRVPVDRATLSANPSDPSRAWYESCRDELLAALRAADPDGPCWVIGGRPDGRVGFWRRRMVFETTKHLIDLRAAGGETWRVAPELSAAEYADAVDELFEVFLARSRATLDPLPAALTLAAADVDRTWTLSTDWQVHAVPRGIEGARVTATAGELALFAWERGHPLAQPDRYAVDGDTSVIEAFARAPVHP